MQITLGRLYRCMITNILSNSVAQIAVITNTGNAPKGMAKKIDNILHNIMSSCTTSA